MSPDDANLFEELDRKQNEVLVQLDQLNARIEWTLREWSSDRAAGDSRNSAS